MTRSHHRTLITLAGLLSCAMALAAGDAQATEIRFRNFSPSAAIGPPADAFAVKLDEVSSVALGAANAVTFVRLPGTPAIPAQFAGNIISAVAAGVAGGGFDAAYNSGSELNKAWGFIYNSGVPFGPTFDEFTGFLYGRSVEGTTTGLELIQTVMDAASRNVVVLPIVGSTEQLSGYFSEPVGDVRGKRGIGLEGLCQREWTFRYLSPGENVLGQACDELVAAGRIPAKKIKFIAAIPGGGSLVDAVKLGQLQGFEFATPLDDVSQLFNGVDNPGTVGVRYVHLPGWQQQFLVTWLIINKQVWEGLTEAQQILVQTVARDHLISSYGENLRQQGPALDFILAANQGDGNPANDMVLVEWPERAQQQLRDATIHFLNARADDATLPAGDRADFVRILEALRKYVRANDRYWDHRQVPTRARFDGWESPLGECWEARCQGGRNHQPCR